MCIDHACYVCLILDYRILGSRLVAAIIMVPPCVITNTIMKCLIMFCLMWGLVYGTRTQPHSRNPISVQQQTFKLQPVVIVPAAYNQAMKQGEEMLFDLLESSRLN
uniref:Uncharacterized protein n=1 Tax=Ciona intestinalis TaxID=7719 RepID=H2XZR0_CIOIN